MLYLVATPIGNLSDITFRAIETLKNSDYILCEDTRHSSILLNHYQIIKPLKSFHKFSEASKEDVIIEDLKQGKVISLISDAGTPGIADPGQKLVQRCRDEGIKVSSIPGAQAAVVALSMSGLNSERFQFAGFLPKTEKALKNFLQDLLPYQGTTICYESPKRLLKTLEELIKCAKERKITVARELTKKFEEIITGYPEELLNHFNKNDVKGEIVLMISESQTKEIHDFDHLSPQEHVEFLQKTYDLSKNEAIKMAATLRSVPKREIYNELI